MLSIFLQKMENIPYFNEIIYLEQYNLEANYSDLTCSI